MAWKQFFSTYNTLLVAFVLGDAMERVVFWLNATVPKGKSVALEEITNATAATATMNAMNHFPQSFISKAQLKRESAIRSIAAVGFAGCLSANKLLRSRGKLASDAASREIGRIASNDFNRSAKRGDIGVIS